MKVSAAGCAFLAICLGCGGAGPSSPSVSLPPSASPSPSPAASAIARFHTTTFAVPFSFDQALATSTWNQHLEQSNWTYFGYRKESNQDAEGISIHALDSIAPSPACGHFNDPWPAWQEWHPTGPADQAFVDWLTAEVPRAFDPAKPVSIGGRDGLQVDVGPEQMVGCDLVWVTRTQVDNA